MSDYLGIEDFDMSKYSFVTKKGKRKEKGVQMSGLE